MNKDELVVMGLTPEAEQFLEDNQARVVARTTKRQYCKDQGYRFRTYRLKDGSTFSEAEAACLYKNNKLYLFLELRKQPDGETSHSWSFDEHRI